MATDIIARGMITEYIAGTNINFTENRDGTVEISASGSISSEDPVARDAIGNHKSDTSNPHNVTPAQIGLGNVDNTSDLDKPISTAVQKAIDNKADKTVATTSADGLMSAEDKGKLDAFEITTTGGKLHDKDIATTDLIPTTLPANGGISDTARQVVGTSSKIRLWEDNEGGNLSLVAPDGVHSMEMDLYDSQGFRIYFYDGSAMYFPVSFNFNTGKFNINGDADTLDGKHANEIATNPNLLINPDFKINQRGVSGTFSETGKYFVDRWKLVSGTVTVNSDGTLTLNGSISQMFENAVGENVTASVSAGTAVYDNSTKTFSITANGEIISWAKLEYGSVATPFIPPDITTELLKCQRFYYRAGNPLDKNNAAESGYYCGFGMVLNSKSNIVSIFLPINMRVAPTCNNGGTLYTSYINGNNNLETVGAINFPSNNVISTKYTFGLKLNISFKDSIMKPISGSCALVIGTTPVAYGGCFALDAEIY